MHHRMLVILLATVSAALLDKRQDGTVDPDIASDCTYYDTAQDSLMNCAYFEDYWGLTHEQFLDYNPSVKNDCSGIKVGNTYCVEVNNGLPRPVKPSPTSTTIQPSPTASPTGIKKPSPTQSGLIESCTDFYFSVENDRCDAIAAKYGTFSFDDFVKWNPAVGPTCSGIWAKTWYCVGIPGTPTTRPTATSATPTPTGGIETPSPVREDMVKTCNKFHFVEKDENCDTIVRKYGTFTSAQFFEWNPSSGASCTGLWLSTWYCIGVPGSITTPTVTPRPSTTLATSTRPTSTGMPCILQFLNGSYCCPEDPKCCNPNAPADPQPSTICGCTKWHKVAKEDNCDTIVSQYKISRTNFDKWNPAVNNGGSCKAMWLGYSVCVGVQV